MPAAPFWLLERPHPHPQLLLVARNPRDPWLVDASLRPLPPSSSCVRVSVCLCVRVSVRLCIRVSVCPSVRVSVRLCVWAQFPSSPEDTTPIGFRADPIQYDLTLTCLLLQRPSIQIRSQSQVPGLGRTLFNPV